MEKFYVFNVVFIMITKEKSIMYDKRASACLNKNTNYLINNLKF